MKGNRVVNFAMSPWRLYIGFWWVLAVGRLSQK